MIMEASKDIYPKEFGAMLRAEPQVIYEISILPGTVNGDSHTIMWMFSKPIDFSVVGSVHSHPNGVLRPSDEDLHMFSNSGPVHLIVGSPYNMDNFRAFDREGREIKINIV